MLNHGIELQLVTRPRLMRRQRPRNGIKGEIVVLVLRAAGRRWDVERQHELAALAGVVEEGRRRHMRGRLLRGLGRGGEANDRGACGQRDQLFRRDDLFDLLKPALVERQNGLAGDLLFL